MRTKWTIAALVVLAGFLGLVMTSAAVAKEFKYDGPPAFTVTYPDDWEKDPENPNKVLWRTKQAGTLPIMEINCTDLPEGLTVADLGKKEYKRRVEKSQQTVAMIVSNKEVKLSDGTPAVETVLNWMYQGYLQLQSTFVGTIKGGKFVYVVVHQYPGDPIWGPGRSLTFK